MTRRPEILAPAGDVDGLRAAVGAGADAVYFGLKDGFNARARATNLDRANLDALMRELHAHGVAGYVALNTLAFDAELPDLEAVVRGCAQAGVDAVIVQDLGVARLVGAIAPGLAIHASTQMTCTDAAGAELARSLGASRVVLARELSFDEIAAIQAASDVDLEVFVHGALCIAYSGQCLTSEALGGRSANRGACAQACRLPYELVVDEVVRDLGDRAYLLSPEDLDATAWVPRLSALGIRSLKIEGRLKSSDYVAATTRLYRRIVDACAAEGDDRADASLWQDDRRSALQSFTRGSGPGFLGGVDHQRLVDARTSDHRGLEIGTCHGARSLGGRVLLDIELRGELARGDGLLVQGGWGGQGEIGGRAWTLQVSGCHVERAASGARVLVWLGPERRVAITRVGDSPRALFKTSDPANERAIRERAEREPYRVPLDVRISGAVGETFALEAVSARGHRARVESDVPIDRARTAATPLEVARDKLDRLGGTAFELRALDGTLPDDAMLPASALNRARRRLVEELVTAMHVPRSTAAIAAATLSAQATPPDRAPPTPGLYVLCRTEAQAGAAVEAGADGVVLDFLELTGTGTALRGLRARYPGVPVLLAPPRVRKPGEEKIDRYLGELRPDGLLVRSLGGLHEAAAGGPSRIGDFSLNVTNRLAAAEVLRRGLAAFTPSYDLDAAQLAALCASPFGAWAEVVVHHPMPLFHMEHCVIAALLSEGHDHSTCGRPCEEHRVSLRDRAGMDHPVEADVGCRNTVFHAAAQSAAGVVPALQKSGVRRFRIELVRETRSDVARLVMAYRALLDGRMTASELRRTLAVEGGYGVVTGSLRVVT